MVQPGWAFAVISAMFVDPVVLLSEFRPSMAWYEAVTDKPLLCAAAQSLPYPLRSVPPPDEWQRLHPAFVCEVEFRYTVETVEKAVPYELRAMAGFEPTTRNRSPNAITSATLCDFLI